MITRSSRGSGRECGPHRAQPVRSPQPPHRSRPWRSLALLVILAAATIVASPGVWAEQANWTSASSPSVARREHSATPLADGKLLVAGGIILSEAGDIATASAEILRSGGGRLDARLSVEGRTFQSLRHAAP